MYKFTALLKSAAKIAFRKKAVLLMMVVLPVLSTFLATIEFGSLDATLPQVAVFTQGDTAYSKVATDALLESKYFIFTKAEYNPEASKQSQLKKLAESRGFNLIVVVPADFEDRLANNQSLYEVYDTGTDARGALLESTVQSTAVRLSSYYALTGGSLDSVVELKTLAKYKANNNTLTLKDEVDSRNPLSGENTTNRFGLAIAALAWFGVFGSSYVLLGIIRERNSQVNKRIVLANVKPRDYLGSKLALSVLIALIQAVLMVIAFKYFVHVMPVSAWELGVLLLGFLVVGVSANLAFVSICKDFNQFMISSVIFINITSMVSGSYWPLDVMPTWMKNASYLTPQRWIFYTVDRINAGVPNALLQYVVIVIGFVMVFGAIASFTVFAKNRNEN